MTRTGRRSLRQTLLTNYALAGMNIVTGVLAARLLGPSGRGELAVIQLWPFVIAVLAAVGMPEALVYFSAKERQRTGTYVMTGVIVATITSLLLIVVGWFFLPSILSQQQDTVIRATQICLLLVPVYAVVLLPSHALRGTGDFFLWNLLRLAPVVVWLAVLALATLVGTGDSRWLAYAQLLGVGVVSVVGLLAVRTKIQGPYRVDWAAARRLIGYGLPAVGASVPQVANLRLDQMIMSAVVPARDLGLYVVGVAWSASVSPVLTAIGWTLFPRVAHEETEMGQRRVLGEMGWAGLLTTVAVTAVACAATPFAIRLLFSPRFGAATAPAAVLVVASGIAGFNFILAEGSRGLGKPVLALWSEGCGLVITAATLVVLLPRYGIMGAAVSSVLGYATVTATLVTGLAREGVRLFHPRATMQAVADLRLALARFRKQ